MPNPTDTKQEELLAEIRDLLQKLLTAFCKAQGWPQ